MIHGKINFDEKIPFLSYSFEDDKIILREYTDYPDEEKFIQIILTWSHCFMIKRRLQIPGIILLQVTCIFILRMEKPVL